MNKIEENLNSFLNKSNNYYFYPFEIKLEEDIITSLSYGRLSTAN